MIVPSAVGLDVRRRAARFRCANPRSGADRPSHPGQSLVELALVSVLLLTVGIGAFELGRAYHASLTMSHAARDGARVGGDSAATDGEIQSAVVASAAPLGAPAVGIVRSGGEVTVTVSYSFTTPVPLVSAFWGGGALSISRSATARLE